MATGNASTGHHYRTAPTTAQSEGLTERSRWSFRAEGKRPPDDTRSIIAPRRVCQTNPPMLSRTLVRNERRAKHELWHTLRGASEFCVRVRRSPPFFLGDLRLFSGTPSGVGKPRVGLSHTQRAFPIALFVWRKAVYKPELSRFIIECTHYHPVDSCHCALPPSGWGIG